MIGIKKALGPTKKTAAPLKSATGEFIPDRAKQMEHQAQQYSELYSREIGVTEKALNVFKCLSVLQELHSDPALEELNKDLDFLDSGKVPGNESIPTEVLKCCKGNIINL